MGRKFWIFFVSGVFFLLCAQTANAKDGLFGVGARFAWENYKTPVLNQVDESGEEVDLGVDVSSLNKTNFGGDFQIRPIDRLVISLALDFGFSKHTMTFVNSSGAGTTTATASTFSLGFLIGAKFYVIEPFPKKAALYLSLSGGKYVSKMKNNASDSGNTVLDAGLLALSDLSAPIVIQFAVGAEFFVAKSFSVGADILGFKMAYSKSSLSATSDYGVWAGTQKLLTLSIYSALTLNFGFYKDGSRSSHEDEVGATLGEDGWGTSGGGSGGGAASGNDSWGSAGASSGAGEGVANDGWAASPSGAAPPSGGNDGWVATPPPADAGAAGNANGGWGAAPPDGGASGGWEAQPPPDNESPVKPYKPKAKPKASGGGGSAPPPPPPGY